MQKMLTLAKRALEEINIDVSREVGSVNKGEEYGFRTVSWHLVGDGASPHLCRHHSGDVRPDASRPSHRHGELSDHKAQTNAPVPVLWIRNYLFLTRLFRKFPIPIRPRMVATYVLFIN
jgi:hypothetical protein